MTSTPHPRDPAMQFRSALPQDATAIRDLVRAADAKWVPLIGREATAEEYALLWRRLTREAPE